MALLEIPGVTDGPDNDYAAQAVGGLEALEDYDIVIIHIEAPDEAGHAGLVDKKIEAIEKIDAEVVSRIRNRGRGQNPAPGNVRPSDPGKTEGAHPRPGAFITLGAWFQSQRREKIHPEAEAGKTDVICGPGTQNHEYID